MTIIPHLDWISFSFDNAEPAHFETGPFKGLSRRAGWSLFQRLGDTVKAEPVWIEVAARQPFHRAVQEETLATRISWQAGQGRGSVELPGRSVRAYAEAGILRSLVQSIASDITRIDYAVDILTDITPKEFVNEREHEKFRTRADMESETGQTTYIGSWSSDRFARVYRYFPPHERSDFLRAEHVFKRNNAKRFAQAWLDFGDRQVRYSVGKVFGWKHPHWQHEPTNEEVEALLKAWRPERHRSSTLRWLEETVAPCIVRLVREGVIEDLPLFIEEHLYLPLSVTASIIPVTPMNEKGKL